MKQLTRITYTNPELAFKEGSLYENICIYRTTFTRCYWEYLAFYGVTFENCIFIDTQLVDCIFVKCIFKSCTFKTTGMHGCGLHSCVFENCLTENTFVNITTTSYLTNNPLLCPDTDYHNVIKPYA